MKVAEAQGDTEMAAILVMGRAFLFRMPSECLPLQLTGEHSEVTIEGDVIRVMLTRRKCSSVPVLLERQCCCRRSGKSLCAFHKMRPVVDRVSKAGQNRLFDVSPQGFLRKLRELAAQCGIPEAGSLGTHALRRGMARDIVDAGGSLATLMRAGDWKSAAYAQYLRENQIEDKAVADLLIDHSDSE